MMNDQIYLANKTLSNTEHYFTLNQIKQICILFTLGDRNSRASCEATGEEAGEAVAGWAGDLLGEEAGMVDRVDMLLGEGELVSGAAS